jgi:hypothetical protein
MFCRANAYYIEYESLQVTNKDNGVEVNERATFHGFIFNRNALAQAISKKANGAASSQTLDITSMDSLKFTLISPTGNKPWEAPSITFSLQGGTTLVSVINTR